MRVLDIDLDFFLAGCCPLADKGRRPELFGHEPWESGRVRRFLEGNCGLSKDRPIPGRYLRHMIMRWSCGGICWKQSGLQSPLM